MCHLSIIIPVYNCEDFLQSRFKQLLPLYDLDISFEIIYVNDGSTDKSIDILNLLKNKYQNLTVVSQENKGSSEARNTGIKIAKGDYIQFLDADEYIEIEAKVHL